MSIVVSWNTFAIYCVSLTTDCVSFRGVSNCGCCVHVCRQMLYLLANTDYCLNSQLCSGAMGTS